MFEKPVLTSSDQLGATAELWGAGLLWRTGLLWRAGLLWKAGLLWRAGLPRAGLRSSPKTSHLGVSDKNGWALLGLLRSPARGKPARHNKPTRHSPRQAL
ncbi:hypothetical protein GDV60_10980 [Pseudomonas sp. DTU12.1]|nr:hypothetical protein GDV60_10980 [Pseudomonas sp. DTU12.1]